ncbi:MAG: redoxin domain-containing protein [Verrucomicrobiales bacterium]|nr:redoxin domain-containing protein [Verrucomicrobiales bacterium]
MFATWLVTALAALLGAVVVAQETGRRAGRGEEYSLPPDARALRIGDPAPDFALKGVDDRTYRLADFKDAKVLMVIFLSNHCPYSHAAETRLLPLAAEFKPRGLAVVAINPNHPDAVRLDELGYSKYDDSFEHMKLYAREAGFTFPYLYDGDTQATAKAYGCLVTPHVFIFDGERKLRYQGRFDDSRFADPATVTSPDARNAVEALLAGRPVPVAETRPFGCSTKWLTKTQEVRAVEAQWKSAPVVLERIDAAGVAALARNPTSKLRLVNLWATWCAPCVREMPGLVAISRRLANRDFELITLSLDDPKHESRVQAFLESHHVAVPNRVQRSLKAEGRRTNNYLFADASTDALAQALDPEWRGPLPHSVLIAPGGKILWRHTGEVDTHKLLERILDELGPYYK